jgi:hypothetical protein
MSALAVGLAACGSTHSAQTSVQPSASFGTPSEHAATGTVAKASSPIAPATAQVSHSRPSRLDGTVIAAEAIYHNETKGRKLFQQLGRIAHDAILIKALSRGDVRGAQAEADAQLRSPVNHFDHVTRISVTRGSQVLVNATVNSDGVFVAAPGTRTLRSHGRVLGTLLVSLQDVTGFVKLVHRHTGAEILVRGGSGRVRTSLPAAAGVRLPVSGQVTIAGRRYSVRSFPETGWGNEPLATWILEPA